MTNEKVNSKKLKIAMLGDSVIIGTTPRKPLFIRVSRA